jgi:hypothetical protein
MTTLGVATEPYPSRGRSHDFVLIRVRIESDAAFAARRDELFGATDMAPILSYWRASGLQ